MKKILLTFFILNIFYGNLIDDLVVLEMENFKDRSITEKMLTKTWNHCQSKKDAHLYKRYQICSGKVYGEDTTIKRLLEVLVQKYEMPDLDFIYYHMDVFKDNFFNRSLKKLAPIFTPCKPEGSQKSILLIDWYYDVASHSEGGWNQIRESINGLISNFPWDLRQEKLCWRGSLFDGWYTPQNWTTIPRGKAVYLSKLYPEIIDAGFVNFAWWHCSDIPFFEREIKTASFLKPKEQLSYKYLLELDGTSATAPALQWKLLSNSCVFKQKSNDILWWHRALKPWVHYIPVERDLSDLLDKLNWAMNHDNEAKKIAEQGRDFALNHLDLDSFLEYSYKVLCEYAKMQKFKVEP